MENKGYTIIQDWMLDLPLSLVETMAYAVIFGFSQDGESAFKGSLAYLARKCKVSKDTIRRALNKLTDEGYVEKIENRINGVTFYDYRIILAPLANCNPTPCKLQPQNNIENIDIKNISNKGRFDFYKSLLQLGVSEQTARDWMEVRKAKRAANTETAFRNIEIEIRKSGMDAESCIRMSAANSWQGFKAEWLQKWAKNGQKPAPKQESVYEHNRRLMQEIMGGYNPMEDMIDEQ